MNRDTILQKVEAVFRDVFDDDELTVLPGTTADDVEGWDSMMHVSLMINVEKAFAIKFSSTQVSSLKNVGALVELIGVRLGASSRDSGGRS